MYEKLKDGGKPEPQFEALVTMHKPEKTRVLLQLTIKNRKGKWFSNWRACDRWIYFNRKENRVHGRPVSTAGSACAARLEHFRDIPYTKNPFGHILGRIEHYRTTRRLGT